MPSSGLYFPAGHGIGLAAPLGHQCPRVQFKGSCVPDSQYLPLGQAPPHSGLLCWVSSVVLPIRPGEHVYGRSSSKKCWPVENDQIVSPERWLHEGGPSSEAALHRVGLAIQCPGGAGSAYANDVVDAAKILLPAPEAVLAFSSVWLASVMLPSAANKAPPSPQAWFLVNVDL